MGVVDDLTVVLAPVEVLLLDFDGPVCRLFAGRPAVDVAARMRWELARAGAVLHGGAATSGDPLEVLRGCAVQHPGLLALAHEVLADEECAAADLARPTPGAADVLAAAADRRRPTVVVVVSNNDARAVHRYLDAAGLGGAVAAVVGRDGSDVTTMKPAARPLELGRRAAGRPGAAVMVGDAVTDMSAARAAGVPGVGFATRPGRDAELRRAGAAVVVAAMTEVAQALRGQPPRRGTACRPATRTST